jgi:hypothetical protein
VSGRHFGSLLTAVVSNGLISQTLSLIIIVFLVPCSVLIKVTCSFLNNALFIYGASAAIE